MFQGPPNPKKPRTFRRSMPPKKATFEAACHTIAIGITGMARNTSFLSHRIGPLETSSREPLPGKKSGWIRWFMVDITWYNELVHGGYNGLWSNKHHSGAHPAVSHSIYGMIPRFIAIQTTGQGLWLYRVDNHIAIILYRTFSGKSVFFFLRLIVVGVTHALTDTDCYISHDHGTTSLYHTVYNTVKICLNILYLL